ncbi:Scr1 family TA system antitoxin-like transcriptional regulator [Streptomyces sp. 7-21]|uniref:Scr1 family TA system antitoxin-like transcriptional regulator n=1 Tax=Streptomyces sp. 7-21 TaxID=2802283 RepID=UPI0035A98938
MTRQEILRRDEAPQLVCVLGEAVLHRQIGSPATLAGQLKRLREVNFPARAADPGRTLRARLVRRARRRPARSGWQVAV